MKKRNHLLVNLGGLVVAGLVAIVAYASIPDSSGVYYGCYKRSGGQLRVIDHPAQQCDARRDAHLMEPARPGGTARTTGAGRCGWCESDAIRAG